MLKVDVLQKLFPPRVEDTVKRLASGDSYKEAARELDVDAETVKSYASAFRRVMQAKNTAEAVAKAVARGIISIKEIDGPTLIACGLIVLTSFNSERAMAKSHRRLKSERREDAITQLEDGGEMVSAWHQGADLRHLVPGGFCDRAIR